MILGLIYEFYWQQYFILTFHAMFLPKTSKTYYSSDEFLSMYTPNILTNKIMHNNVILINI